MGTQPATSSKVRGEMEREKGRPPHTVPPIHEHVCVGCVVEEERFTCAQLNARSHTHFRKYSGQNRKQEQTHDERKFQEIRMRPCSLGSNPNTFFFSSAPNVVEH